MSSSLHPCPYCREPIQPGAMKCRFCFEMLPEGWNEKAAAVESPSGETSVNRGDLSSPQSAVQPATDTMPPHSSAVATDIRSEPATTERTVRQTSHVSTPISVSVSVDAQDRPKNGVAQGIAWMFGISLLLFFLPLLGPLIAGIVGGKKSGGVLNGIMAALIPSLAFASLLLSLTSGIANIPILGLIATWGALAIAFAGSGPLLVGAILGGVFAAGQGEPISKSAMVVVLVLSTVIGIRVYWQVTNAMTQMGVTEPNTRPTYTNSDKTGTSKNNKTNNNTLQSATLSGNQRQFSGEDVNNKNLPSVPRPEPVSAPSNRSISVSPCLSIDGEDLASSVPLPGWFMLSQDEPLTTITTTMSAYTVHSGSGAIHIHGDFQVGKALDSPGLGIVTVDYWHFPQPGSSTNSGLKLYGAQFSTSEFLTVHKNDQNLWWVSGVKGPVASYNGQYTHIVITVNTNTGRFDVSINGQQVATQVMVSNPDAISQGIQNISTWSGRGGAGTDSYIDDLVITSR